MEVVAGGGGGGGSGGGGGGGSGGGGGGGSGGGADLHTDLRNINVEQEASVIWNAALSCTNPPPPPPPPPFLLSSLTFPSPSLSLSNSMFVLRY